MIRGIPMNCDQCQALRINGVYCHETGCPNEDSRYDRATDRWILQRTCFVCRVDVDYDSLCSCEEDESTEDYSDDGRYVLGEV